MSNPTFAWPSPAKINLFLKITGRRADGYHNLQSVFQFLELRDDIYFELTDDGALSLASPLPDVPDSAHLCVRAANALRDASNYRGAGVRIRVTKRIPVGAGLGGGSSNAATTLVALNNLWSLALPVDELAEIGVSLGADIPVFVRGFAAWAEGIGEKLIPIYPSNAWFSVIHPGCEVSTAKIFGLDELTRNSCPIKIPRSLTDETDPMSADELVRYAANDCEAAVRSMYPEVDKALAHLSKFGHARMTGTGSAVFAAFPSEELAHAAVANLPPVWWSVVTRSTNRSPLSEWLVESGER